MPAVLGRSLLAEYGLKFKGISGNAGESAGQLSELRKALVELLLPPAPGRHSRSPRVWHRLDRAVLVETTEEQTERSLVRNIEVFRRVGDAYRRSHEVHSV